MLNPASRQIKKKKLEQSLKLHEIEKVNGRKRKKKKKNNEMLTKF